MQLIVERVVSGADVEPAWQLYERAFDELRRTAVQRHMMYRNEFDDVMADERIWKYRVVDESAETPVLAGLATFTNELHALPLLSPDYFEHRWPDLFAQKRIWYISLFAVDPDHRQSGAFEQIIAHMWQQVLQARGIGLLDICRRNDELGLPRAIHQVLQAMTPSAQASPIDEQTYWLYQPGLPE